MSPGILGKKIGMTQMFRPDGQAGAGHPAQGGSMHGGAAQDAHHGWYDAMQLGLVEFVKPQRINKPATGHLKKGWRGRQQIPARVPPGRPGDAISKLGDKVLVDQFKPKDKVDVIGVSKGRGFAGLVKRHHFRGGEGTHGSMFHRAPVPSALPVTPRVWCRGCAWRATWAMRASRCATWR